MLDREAEDSYYVRIVASDNGSPRQSGSVLINIAVTDRNDNAPVFMSSNYSVRVNEHAPIRQPILTVSAVDQDINDNGQVMYRLSSRVGPGHPRSLPGRGDGRADLPHSASGL